MENINFNKICSIIEERKNNAYRKINEELIGLYWDFGKYVSSLIRNSKWGSKVVEDIVKFMNNNYPQLKAFNNKRSIYRMCQFYETYKDNEIVSPLVTQLSWTNNLIILSSTKSIEEKEFYIKLCIKNNYTKRELERQINSGYYERYMLSGGKTNEKLICTIEENDYPNPKILDTYSLEFLDFPNNFTENDLKKSIIKNMKEFILEIGKDFSFIAEEYRIEVGNEDYYIDLLFYNRRLSCLVAIELKIGKFKPEYISKMDFYLEALDREKKLKHENPSIGIILCTSKNEQVVEYSISRSISPTMVSSYKINLPDKKILEDKLKKLNNIVAEVK